MFPDRLKITAEKLVQYCRENKTDEGLDELYDSAALSIEAIDMPDSGGAESRGLEAIKAKHDWWYSNFEVHDQNVEGPFYHGEHRFGVIFGFDATNKQNGERTKMKELGLYEINSDGKIVREEFYYSA